MSKSKRGKASTVKWYNPEMENTGWYKDKPEKERRAMMLRAHGGDVLSSAQALQALANVSTDQKTRRRAAGDAAYFYKKYDKMTRIISRRIGRSSNKLEKGRGVFPLK
jgi:hypothetical protein